MYSITASRSCTTLCQYVIIKELFSIRFYGEDEEIISFHTVCDLRASSKQPGMEKERIAGKELR